MDGHLCSGYTGACYATALVKIEVPVQKFYAPINPVSAAVAELSSQKLKVPELTPLKMRGAGTPFRLTLTPARPVSYVHGSSVSSSGQHYTARTCRAAATPGE